MKKNSIWIVLSIILLILIGTIYIFSKVSPMLIFDIASIDMQHVKLRVIDDFKRVEVSEENVKGVGKHYNVLIDSESFNVRIEDGKLLKNGLDVYYKKNDDLTNDITGTYIASDVFSEKDKTKITLGLNFYHFITHMFTYAYGGSSSENKPNVLGLKIGLEVIEILYLIMMAALGSTLYLLGKQFNFNKTEQRKEEGEQGKEGESYRFILGIIAGITLALVFDKGEFVLSKDIEIGFVALLGGYSIEMLFRFLGFITETINNKFLSKNSAITQKHVDLINKFDKTANQLKFTTEELKSIVNNIEK